MTPDWAEADAIDAVDFASAAIEEAEYAVLGAVSARRKADVMAARRMTSGRALN